VRLDEHDDSIQLTVQDDGCGMALPVGKKTFGLLGMRERVHMLGGRFEIESEHGKGTRIGAWLPTNEGITN